MSRMPNRTSIAALVAVALTMSVLGGAVLLAPAEADAYISEPFTGSSLATPSNWSTSNSGSGPVCLTALSSSAPAISLNGGTTLPGCTSSPVTVGSGALRLVAPITGQSSSLFYKQAQSTTYGLEITFTMAMQGSGGAGTIGNGMSFFLKDGSNATDTAGPGGAPLGYARYAESGVPQAAGVPGGLVGVGFDVYGGFGDSDYFATNGCDAGTGAGSAGPSSTLQPNMLGVRGADTSASKNGSAGYCWISGTTSVGGNLYGASVDAAKRKVRIVVDPKTAARPKVMVYLGAAGGGPVPGTPTLEFDQPQQLKDATSFKFGFSASTGLAVLGAYVWDVLITKPNTQILYAVPGNYTYVYGTNPGTITPSVVYQTTLGAPASVVADPTAGNTGWTAPTCSATGTFNDSTNAGTSTGAISCTGGDGGLLYTLDTTSVANVIVSKATALCSVTPYTAGYTGSSITATGSCTGVGGATVTGLDLTRTTHTSVGTYTDSWTFTNANYSDASGTVTNTINALAPSVPAAPTSSAVGNGTVTLAWVAPAANGAALSGYNVQVATSAGGSYADASGCASLAVVTTCTATGLINGTSYYFKVRATNSAGDGSYSPAGAGFTPTTVPSAPAAPTSSAVGNGTVTLAWVAPAANGAALSGYNVQVATSAGGSYADASGCASLAVVTTCTATGLTNGTAYYFKVRATNSAGNGDYSPASAGFTPAIAPSTPAAPTSASVGNGTVTLAWVAPAANGAAITGYNVQVAAIAGGSYADATGCTSLAVVTTCTATGLINGTSYYFKVLATSAAGSSIYSAASAAFMPVWTPATPTAPTSLVQGDGTVTLAWVAPATNGAALSGYNVQVATSAGGSYADATGCASLAVVTTCMATGLINGTSYYFKVRATNSIGNGTYSLASAAFTPIAAATKPSTPGAPTSTSVGNGTVSLLWVAPAADGAAITGYNMQVATSASGTYADATGCAGLGVVLTCTATGLTNGTEYFFKVRATNSVGNSAYSAASAAFTPAAVPLAPAAPTSTAVGNGTVTLAWAPPSPNGAVISGYNVQVATSAGGPFADVAGCSNLGVVTGCTAIGLVSGRQYFFQVRANSATGNSANSASSAGFTPVAATGGSSTSTTTTPQTPTATDSRLGPVLPGSNPNMPAAGMPLGASVLLINGQAQPVTTKPNALQNPTGLIASGPGFTLQVEARSTAGRAIDLAPSGALTLEPSGRVTVQGSGFAPNSNVVFYLFSDPRVLGTVTAGGSGILTGAVAMPGNVATGRHTLQANGFGSDGTVRSLSLSVQVTAATSAKGTTRTQRVTVRFMAGSAQLSPAAKTTLRSLVTARSATATKTIVLGYMQSSDKSTKGASLAQRRAISVAKYLKSLGLKGTVNSRGGGVAKKAGEAGRTVVVRLSYGT